MRIDNITYKLKEAYLYITVDSLFTSYRETLDSSETPSNEIVQKTTIIGGGEIIGNKFILIKDNETIETINKVQFQLLKDEDKNHTQDVDNPKGSIHYTYSDISYIKVEKFRHQTIFLDVYIPKETFERIKSFIGKGKVDMDITFLSKLFSSESNDFSNYILDSEQYYELELVEFSLGSNIHERGIEDLHYEIKNTNQKLDELLQATSIQSKTLKYTQFISLLFTILVFYILFVK